MNIQIFLATRARTRYLIVSLHYANIGFTVDWNLSIGLGLAINNPKTKGLCIRLFENCV